MKQEIIKAYSYFEESNKLSLDYKKFIDCIYKNIGIKKAENVVWNKRILCVLVYVEENLHTRITCSDVAKHIFYQKAGSRIYLRNK